MYLVIDVLLSFGPFRPQCTHSGKFKTIYRCQELLFFDIKKFHEFLYSKPSKEVEDYILADHMQKKGVKRHLVSNADAKKIPSKFKVNLLHDECRKAINSSLFSSFYDDKLD